MNLEIIPLAGVELNALPSGALWWPDEGLICVSDLHLGKSERIARRGGPALPPYENLDTLTRLSDDIDRTQARRVICLGDSFDDLGAAIALPNEHRDWITRLQAGRDWIWVEGNHDPGPIDLGGTHRSEVTIGPLTFRHIAVPGARGEISGHYHPKLHLNARGRRLSRPVFLFDSNRLILPAYGTYTGGLSCDDPALRCLFTQPCWAVMTGAAARKLPIQ